MNYRQNRAVAWRTIDGEAVLIDPSSGTVFVLNRLGSRIWELLQESRTRDDLVRAVCDRKAPPVEEVAADVSDFLDAMTERELVETEK